MRKSPLRNFDYWKGLGFAVVPKDKRSGSLALNARDYLSALPCWKQASNMVDAGYMPGEIADFIRNQNGGDLGVTLLTLKKYIQLYRRHFVRPLTAVRSTAARIKVEGQEA